VINKGTFISLMLICAVVVACKEGQKAAHADMRDIGMKQKKKVVYQVFTRLFGNTNTTNTPWGTLSENGVGKFNDFTDTALKEIKDLGVTHIWYTGVPHHNVITDYTAFGISNDDPDVVKGRAGSPYAVKDYYSVNPDLAVNPAERMQEFKALVARSHKAGLKVIIDIVPNHVARNYEGRNTPPGAEPFGQGDDTSVAYHRENDFYYIPGEAFKVPQWQNGYQPLGGEKHPLIDHKFRENPAKWTGNGSRLAQPDFNDWYETVKINYGVRPDGSFDFEVLPANYGDEPISKHMSFWAEKNVPGSWVKFKDIALFWMEMGVDGFRYDMAEMVPVEFWSYMNSHIKTKNPDAFLLAEVYDPGRYRDYIHKGKMDYLYDKVEMYDSLKHIMKGYGWTDHIPVVREGSKDIEQHLLLFLENHDEQRIASPAFAGDANIGKPAMVVSATISTAPVMTYFGQEVGEPGAEKAGFGDPTRTSIFDYIGVPHHQRWLNDKKFDGGQLSKEEKELRDFYKRLLNFTVGSEALMGSYQDIHYYNRQRTAGYNHRVLSYVRWSSEENLIIISNFDAHTTYSFRLQLPEDVITKWKLNEGTYTAQDMLYGSAKEIQIKSGKGEMELRLAPLESYIFKIKK
jgi:glycosidase